jgi:archaemetzincin
VNLPARLISPLLIALVLFSANPVSAETPDRGPRVCIQPLGKYDRKLLGKSVLGIKYLYGYRVKVLQQAEMPPEAFYKPRKRHRADELLRFLEETVAVRDDCDIAVGFTRQDISTSKGEHKDWGIFGLGSVGGTCCVVSTHRLTRKTKKRRLMAIRTVKVVNHELGHVLGLGHCPKEGCLMADAKGTIKTVDNEQGQLCELCHANVTSAHGALPEIDQVDWDELLGQE